MPPPTRKSATRTTRYPSPHQAVVRHPGVRRSSNSVGSSQMIRTYRHNTTQRSNGNETSRPDVLYPDTQTLPSGCALGIPVTLGHLDSAEMVATAMMQGIQSDNYTFIRHMIIQGWTPVSPTACRFAIRINSEGKETQVWQVREATPLHYAVCCGSLEAAAGLVVAFPELAFASCEVGAGGGADSMGRRSRWTALEFASFFGSLYVGVDSGRHGAYQEASLVLLHLKEHPRRLPFMQHHTPALRLAAAPKRPHGLLAVIRAVVS